MCYLVAKNFNKQGCVALKTKHGKELAMFSRELTDKNLNKGIQIVTISHPEAYGEYAPYTIIENKLDFAEYVSRM